MPGYAYRTDLGLRAAGIVLILMCKRHGLRGNEDDCQQHAQETAILSHDAHHREYWHFVYSVGLFPDQYFHVEKGIMMNRNGLIRAASIVLVFVPMMALAAETTALQEIMQGLRNNLVEIADGLLADDFEQVARGATAIAEHPQIPPAEIQLVAAVLGPEMPAFKQLDVRVHDLSLEIHAAANALDRDAAISGFQHMIEGCLACHHAYKTRVATVLSQAPGQ